MLRDMGASAASALQMCKSGWLERLSQGVYLLTGDALSPDGCIAHPSRTSTNPAITAGSSNNESLDNLYISI
jgi:hypothetical protein